MNERRWEDMERKISRRVLANAISLTGLIYWVIDYIAFLILPGSFPSLNRALSSVLGISPLVFSSSLFFSFIFGALVVVISSWIFGYILGWSINYFAQREAERAMETKHTEEAHAHVHTG